MTDYQIVPFEQCNRESLRKSTREPVVYGWFRDSTCLYIGSSRNGLTRVAYHRYIRVREGDHIKVWRASAEDLRRIELELWDYYQPKFGNRPPYYFPGM